MAAIKRAVTRWRQGSGLAGRVRRQARRARRGLGKAIEERPLAVGLAALGVGLLAGVALPATRREDELLGETRDDLLASARDAGQDVLAKGREVARDAVARVKESVREQELTPEQLAEKARQVARDAAATLRHAEREVAQSLAGEPAWPPEPTGSPRL